MKKLISKVLVSAMALTMISGIAPAEEVIASGTEYYIFAGSHVSWNVAVGYNNDDWDDDRIVVIPEGGRIAKNEIDATANSTWNTVNAGDDFDFSISNLGQNAKISYMITVWNEYDTMNAEDFDGESMDLAAEIDSNTGEAAFTEEVYVLTRDGVEMTADSNYSTTATDTYSAKLHFSKSVWNEWCCIFVKVEKGGGSEEDDSYTDTAIIERVSGPLRYDTSIAAAEKLKTVLDKQEKLLDGKFKNIVVAGGESFPDALSGSYLAAKKDAPIILVANGKGGSVMTQMTEYIKANLAEGGTLYVLGGTGAVPATFEEKMGDEYKAQIVRLAGKDRYETNIMILETAGIKSSEDILVCTGTSYADSLSASATGKPILLVPTNRLLVNDNVNQKEFIAGLNGYHGYYLIGGTGVVTENVESEIAKSAEIASIYRVAGANRFTTSTAVAEMFFENPHTITLAYSHNFPDGLSAGPLAYASGSPLILTQNNWNAIPIAQEYIKDNYDWDYNGLRRTYVLGGDSLISDMTAHTITATVEKYFTYIINDGTATIIDCPYTAETVIIPSEIEGCRVTRIGDNTFYACEGLTNVVIPNSVTTIGDYAFFLCDNLTSIEIPYSVSSIGIRIAGACDFIVDDNNEYYSSIDGILFNKDQTKLIQYSKTNAKEYSIPNSVTAIGDHAFSSSKGLTSIVIPKGVTTIGEYAFMGCYGLTGIDIPESVTTIGEYAFDGCDGLKSIIIPDSVTAIGKGAFLDCFNLKSVVISDNVTMIDDMVFRGCSGMTSITIPDSVTSIGDSAFLYCVSLKSVVIPDNVTSIGAYAFRVCEGLTSIVIPSSVTTIGTGVFNESPNVKILCNSGSAAYRYAINNGIAYQLNS